MRIGIEAQRLFREKKHGMDIFALEFIRSLQKIDQENEYVIFIKPDKDDSVLKETGNFKIARLAGGIYPAWEQYALPEAAKKAGCQILHCTGNTGPIICKIPMIITLHDIIYMETSYIKLLTGTGTPYQKFGNNYRKFIVPRLVNKVRKFITVSQAEKQRIASFFNIRDDNRLAFVYNGVGEHFRPVTYPMELQLAKNRYGLPDNFFFFLGNTDPKKNVKGTLQAFSTFVTQTDNDFQLVIADYDQSNVEIILKEIGAMSLMNRILLTGYIPNISLPAVYSLSTLFLYPSLRESFGIPILEAMACGVPVITSNLSSMPEVAGEAALLVDPYLPGEIADAMALLSADVKLRDQYIAKGLLQAAKFTWKSTASNILNQYQEIGKGLT
ncbi:MAG: glycosyltransferase family 1 protein [Bacteroidetes bacterium]|nr:glycosyltransferase family 1 protein [Bacteroidota bacterium]